MLSVFFNHFSLGLLFGFLGLQFLAEAKPQGVLEKLFTLPGANVVEPSLEGEGVLYVATLEGELFKVNGTVKTLFLDLTKKTANGSERGLIGFALHPNFSNVSLPGYGKFYVHYSHSELSESSFDHVAVVSEFSASSTKLNKADPKSERVLLKIPQPQGNHNGGDLEFGPDGFLYIALGDGGAAHDVGSKHTKGIGNAQDKTNLLGKILRIDVQGVPYKIPPTNPFAKSQGAERKEIFAYGLRNPYRFNFDEGKIWAGDVGQHRWEELDVVELGGNYGWPFREGFQESERLKAKGSQSYINPVLVYPNPKVGKSIIGGQFYKGKRHKQYIGKYVFGDFYSDYLFVLIAGNKFLEDKKLKVGSQLTDIARDKNGNLYFTTLGGDVLRL